MCGSMNAAVERGAGDVDHLDGLARSPPGDDAVDDREIGVDPLAGARDEDPPARISRSAGSSPRATARILGVPRRGGIQQV